MAHQGGGPPPHHQPGGIPPYQNHQRPAVFWGGSATQHLAAGMYLDPVFRRTALNQVVRRRYRELAPSYGFEPLPVLFHARRAQQFDLLRDAVLVGIQLILLCTLSTALVGVYGTLLSWYQLVLVAQVLGALVTVARTGVPLRTFRRVWARALGFSLFTLFVSVPLFVYSLSVSLNAAAPSDGQSTNPGSDRGGVLASLSGYSVGATVTMLVLVTVCVAAGSVRQSALDRLAHSVDPSASAGQLDLAARIPRQIVTYAGVEPFLGSGAVGHEWSFTHRLVPDLAAGELRPEQTDRARLPFTTKDVVDYLRGRFIALRDSPLDGQRLPGFTIQDGIYLSDLYSYPVPDAPIPPYEHARIVNEAYEQVRHYLVLQVVGWRGEVVTTVYVRVSVQGGMLYLEFSARELPPTKPEYRVIDTIGGVGVSGYIRMVWQDLRDVPTTVAFSAFRLLRTGLDAAGGVLARNAAAGQAQLAARRFGPAVSIRQEGSALPPYHYFQEADFERFTKVVERRLLADLIVYLRDQGVDVAEFRQRAGTILNYGVQHFGVGDITVEQSAVGQGNQVNSGGRDAGKR